MTTQSKTIPQFPAHYRIRLAVELAGLTVEDVARELDVHTNTVHNYMSGRSRCRRPALRQIAALTNVDPEWLETGEVGNAAMHPHSLGYPARRHVKYLLKRHFQHPVTAVWITA